MCSSPNGIQFFKPMRGIKPGNEICVGVKGDTYSVLEGKTERKTNLENLSLDMMIILK